MTQLDEVVDPDESDWKLSKFVLTLVVVLLTVIAVWAGFQMNDTWHNKIEAHQRAWPTVEAKILNVEDKVISYYGARERATLSVPYRGTSEHVNVGIPAFYKAGETITARVGPRGAVYVPQAYYPGDPLPPMDYTNIWYAGLDLFTLGVVWFFLVIFGGVPAYIFIDHRGRIGSK